MNPATRSRRMRECLERQVAVLEGMLRDLESLESDMESGHFDRLAMLQEAHRLQTRALEEEFNVLSREWESSAGADEAERASLRGLARHAGDLAARVAKRQEQGRALADAHRAQLQQEWDTLRRGRGMLGKYGTGGDGADASFIDRKA